MFMAKTYPHNKFKFKVDGNIVAEVYENGMEWRGKYSVYNM